ncbi:hypothetical protein ScPMuIL_006472 [Solemya velum]
MMAGKSVLTLAFIIPTILGHGRLIEPPSRSSMWRYGFNTPKNYNDNELFCGGFNTQWNVNGGNCGVCGDSASGIRDNEAGGRYATGVISRCYPAGTSFIQVKVEITANHKGGDTTQATTGGAMGLTVVSAAVPGKKNSTAVQTWPYSQTARVFEQLPRPDRRQHSHPYPHQNHPLPQASRYKLTTGRGSQYLPQHHMYIPAEKQPEPRPRVLPPKPRPRVQQTHGLAEQLGHGWDRLRWTSGVWIIAITTLGTAPPRIAPVNQRLSPPTFSDVKQLGFMRECLGWTSGA